jgi:hypothetical protein
MSWWDRMFLSRKVLSDIQATVWRVESKINGLGNGMADVSQVLNDVAAGLRDNLGPRISELLAENSRLRVRNAELEGEDVAESDAATNTKSAFDQVAGLFDQTEEAPTPDPLPEPPAEGGPVVVDESQG